MALRTLAILGLVGVSFAANPARPSHDWLTWGGDPERSGWAKDETAISKETAGRLELKWRLQLDNVPAEVVLSSLTAPLVIENVKTRQGAKNLVFVVGSADILYAIDADRGKVVWQKSFTAEGQPKLKANWMCPNSQNATPDVNAQLALAKTNSIPVVTFTETLTPAGASFVDWQVAQLNALKAALATATGK